MMTDFQDFIEAEYEVIPEQAQKEQKPDKRGGDITINADPFSAFISGAFGTVNNITNAVKEYGMCKQQEETKRAEIKAQMKVQIEQIRFQRDMCLKYLEDKHQEQMAIIQNHHEKHMKLLDNMSRRIDKAIEMADSELVHDLLRAEAHVIEISNELELKYMELSGSSPLPKGYLQ